jgi:hypothetical protein
VIVDETERDEQKRACELSETRRGLVEESLRWRLPRRVSLISAALFAGLAAKGERDAQAHPGQGNFRCCSLARPDQWCAPASGTTVFSCDHGGFKRIWYCCTSDGIFVGCGECQSSTGTCFGGPLYYCSYGWVERTAC